MHSLSWLFWRGVSLSSRLEKGTEIGSEKGFEKGSQNWSQKGFGKGSEKGFTELKFEIIEYTTAYRD
jgi:hypothetical protein